MNKTFVLSMYVQYVLARILSTYSISRGCVKCTSIIPYLFPVCTSG